MRGLAVDKTTLYNLWTDGLTDEQISDKMELPKEKVRRARRSLELVANTSDSGVLGDLVADFLEDNKEKLTWSGKSPESTKECIHMCQNCIFDDCINCFDIAERRGLMIRSN